MGVMNKRGQVTIFIILAIILVVGIVLYFIFSGDLAKSISKDLQKGEDVYKSCIMDRAKLGISLLGQQGGYIYLDELQFYPGSLYMPSSSQLDFYGNAVPYWMFVSGNNIMREQKPTMEIMTSELTRFISEGMNSCNFDSLNSEGIYVDVYNGSVDVSIKDNSVEVLLSNPIFISFENQSATVGSHKISVNSKLGKFYDLASLVYEKQKKDAFLEEYGLDVMQLYAPVTGVEFSCVPKYFNEAQVKNNITQGLEENVASLKVSGNYYDLNNPKHSYFVVDVGQRIDENVNFIYSENWPTRVEMSGDKLVQPVGNQQGLGMFGLCFVPYHFVYNINFPVLIQFYDTDEIFQFGVVAIIQNSQSRDVTLGSNEILSGEQICENSNAEIGVSVFDLDLNPVVANLRFSCLGQSCEIGSSSLGTSRNFQVPMCVNGVLDAYAEGYAPASVTISTNRESDANILMKKIYDVNVSLNTQDKVTVVFSSTDYSSVLNYPDEKSVGLVEGEYNITAFVYRNTSINFAGVKDTKCLDVPSSSIGGIFGSTEQRCYDFDIPAQEIDSALVGGGKAFDYFTEEQLSGSEILKLEIPIFDVPQNIEALQNNYLEWEVSRVDLSFE